MKLSRDWATPATIGSFVLMATTGILMFFHLDTGLNKPAHEWLGWLMVAAVATHAGANWLAFRRHVLQSRTGRLILAASVVVIAGSFVRLPGPGAGKPSAPALAIQAISGAPLSQVAPLTGRSVTQLQADLAAAGIQVPSGDQSLASVIGGDKGRTARALNVMFGSTAH